VWWCLRGVLFGGFCCKANNPRAAGVMALRSSLSAVSGDPLHPTVPPSAQEEMSFWLRLKAPQRDNRSDITPHLTGWAAFLLCGWLCVLCLLKSSFCMHAVLRVLQEAEEWC
jgi:hypothetical protein